MSFGTDVGLGLRDIVFDGDPATPRRMGTPTPPIFGPRLLSRGLSAIAELLVNELERKNSRSRSLYAVARPSSV